MCNKEIIIPLQHGEIKLTFRIKNNMNLNCEIVKFLPDDLLESILLNVILISLLYHVETLCDSSSYIFTFYYSSEDFLHISREMVGACTALHLSFIKFGTELALLSFTLS